MRSATRVNTSIDLKRVDNRLSLLSGGATLSYAESSALLALLDVSSVSSEYLVLPADDEDDDADDDDDLDDDDDDLGDDDDDDDDADDDDEDLEDDDDFGEDDEDLEDDDLEEEEEDEE